MDVDAAPISSTATAVRTRRGVRSLLALPQLVAAGVGGVLVLWRAAPVQSAPPALAFRLPTIARGALALQTLRGYVVLLNFFNTNCPPCIAEMPVLR